MLSWMTTFCNCRPQNGDDKTDLINVHDTEDEFVIKKPDSADPKYTDFLDELYRHDTAKKDSKSKRDISDASKNIPEKVPIETNTFDIKAITTDENNTNSLSHLYRNDNSKRNKRMIIFR